MNAFTAGNYTCSFFPRSFQFCFTYAIKYFASINISNFFLSFHRTNHYGTIPTLSIIARTRINIMFPWQGNYTQELTDDEMGVLGRKKK